MIDGPKQDRPPDRLPWSAPVTRQPTSNSCVLACVDMLLESYHPCRKMTLVGQYRLVKEGIAPSDMASFAYDNFVAIGRAFRRGTFTEAMNSGEPFLVAVESRGDGHAVVIDGSQDHDGIEYLRVKDPMEGSYLHRRGTFEIFCVLEDAHVGWPAIWGEQHA